MRYICTLCNYIHENANPASSAANSTFDELPDNWACPICAGEKSFFQPCNCVKYDELCKKTKYTSAEFISNAA